MHKKDFVYKIAALYIFAFSFVVLCVGLEAQASGSVSVCFIFSAA